MGRGEGWKKVRLGDVAEIVGGTTPSRKVEEFWGGDIPWVTPTDVTGLPSGVTEISAASETITGKALQASSLRLLPPGSVLMTSRATIGAAVVNRVPVATNQGFCNFIPKKDVNANFLAYYLSHVKPQIERLASGSTFLEVSKRTMRSLEIPLPPAPEQERIAEVLGSVDGAIQATRAVIKQTRKVKQGMLQELLTRGIGHTRFKKTEIGEVPEGWEVVTLGEVLNGIVPGRSPSANSDPAGPSEAGVLKVSAVGFGQFFPHENKALPAAYPIDDRFRVRSGDLLITRANTKELVGAACVVPAGEYNLMLCDKTLRLELRMDRVTPQYACAVLLSDQVRAFLRNNASGTSGSMKNISQSLIRSVRVPLPSLEEQQRINGILTAHDNEVRLATASFAHLNSIRHCLMRDLIGGPRA